VALYFMLTNAFYAEARPSVSVAGTTEGQPTVFSAQYLRTHVDAELLCDSMVSVSGVTALGRMKNIVLC